MSAAEPSPPAAPREPLFYSQDGQIRRRALRTEAANGIVFWSFDVEICRMALGFGEDAEHLVDLLNRGQEALELEMMQEATPAEPTQPDHPDR